MILGPRDGREIPHGTTTVRLKLTAAQTGGTCFAMEVELPPHSASAFHIHHREDEAFQVLEGAMSFHVDERYGLTFFAERPPA